MMDARRQKFIQFLKVKGIDCVELDRTIEAAGDTDLSRVLWSLAHLRHIRDLELYKKDMPDKCRQAIQRVADLCAIQAHTDVAREAWDTAENAATRAANRETAYSATRSATWAADAAAYSATRSATWAADAAAHAAHAAEWSAGASASASASASARAAGSAHYKWERDTLTELITNLTYK